LSVDEIFKVLNLKDVRIQTRFLYNQKKSLKES
jgi:hypothetical protein